MIAALGPTFLRRPHGAEWIADAVRVLAVVSIPVAAVGWGGVSFAVMMLALFGTVVPRTLGLRPALDVGLSALALVAGWSSVLEWYTSVFLWDKVIHVGLCGALAALVYVIGVDLRVVPPAGTTGRVVVLVLCGTAGLALGGVWEMCEWVGHTFVDATIRVGYDDTIGDLAADLGGGLAVGLVMPWLSADRRVVRRRTERPVGRTW